MEFKTAAQKECYEKIAPWVKEIFGTFVFAREDVPAFVVTVGTAMAQVGPFPWGDNDATITTRSYVVTGAEFVADLMEFLLHENDRMRFGAFGVDDDKDIFFEHTIVGSTCDKEELKASILAVILTADQYDEKITSRWGGQSAKDRMQR
jgi:hypothetical protein